MEMKEFPAAVVKVLPLVWRAGRGLVLGAESSPGLQGKKGNFPILLITAKKAVLTSRAAEAHRTMSPKRASKSPEFWAVQKQ